MTIQGLCELLQPLAPSHLAEAYDNVGLLVGNGHNMVQGVLVALELTEAVLDEALSHACNVIVAHHPVWFGKRARLTAEDWVGRLLLRAIESQVAIVAIHTNLDNVPWGVNYLIGNKLGLVNLSILQPNQAQPKATQNEQGLVFGAGMVGEWEVPKTKEACLQHMKQVFGCQVVRYADAPISHIQKVAYCGGSGSFLLEAAVNSGAQAFITGDVTHHKFFDADGRILYLDIGHWESERFTPEIILNYLTEKTRIFAVRLSAVQTNPVKYYC